MKAKILFTATVLMLACSAKIYSGPGPTVGMWSAILMFPSTPNPTDAKCLIRVYLPQNDVNAAIKIFNSDSTMVKQVSLAAETGVGSAVVDVSDLQPGNYTYQLYYEGETRYTKALAIKR